jgi:hypothetical protein
MEVATESEVADTEGSTATPINEIGSNTDMSDEVVPAKALKRKGRATQANVDADVILETSASEGKDRPQKRRKGSLLRPLPASRKLK